MTAAASRVLKARDYIRAGLVTACVPMALAFTAYWLSPWRCDAVAWLCLSSLSLLIFAPIAALGLPLACFFNRKRRRPIDDGWLSTVLLSGCAAQLIVSGSSLFMLAAYVDWASLYQALIFPEGFVAGALTGAIFRFALIWSSG